ncbi:uncharacterized protein LOC133664703 [Entelurus aequoreus]|uniref:uncharacterized protein LOC133664703 n=1 Tax=Entelurus aequoreus TaxID=161455 RepID=UPI002B1DCC60|nr:uncharacterized protein LOC133664703 [Entelurus aequoreus]XP_061925527.1 uncharacterized protein LOC133664703 [Entelurus aequoreus]XP_061925528.1 uncharacterized protein LOC133664703 [Entelurus aequoreus]
MEAAAWRRAALVLLLLARLRRRGRRRTSRYWVHPRNQHRRQQGDFYHLVAELRLDGRRHRRYFRMSAEQMDQLLSMIGPEITKVSTNYRAAIEAKQRLAVALRYLATGDSLSSIALDYRLGHTTVMNSVHMVCAAIEKVTMKTFLPRPTAEMWKEVAQRFWQKWNFPNCLGALDGKHMVVQAPPRSGSRYFTFVLLALVDADYRFRCVEVGDFGGVYSGSDLGIQMEKSALHVPPPRSLPGAAHIGDVPHLMAGDTAFPLKPYLMRPYPGQKLTHKKRIFNYRLSRARRVAGDSFGILACRWRILQRRINLQPQNVQTLVMAACILHNFLLEPNENVRLLLEAEEDGRRMAPARNIGGNRASREARAVRDNLATFFLTPEGSVAWQDKMV